MRGALWLWASLAGKVRTPEAPWNGVADRPVAMMVLLAVMGLVPFAVLTLTSFSKMAVVFSLLRSALGTQQAPPTMVLTGLAAILSAYVMAPVAQEMARRGEASHFEGASTARLLSEGARVLEPLRDFLVRHGDAEERVRLVDLAGELRSAPSPVSASDLTVVVPAFVLTELKEAFQIGFIVFLPFLVIDMVVANVLLALGMQTLSPTQVSLAFKILLFVAVDGWSLLSRGLLLGYR